MFNQPFKLQKRFRFEEQHGTLPKTLPWTKTIINFDNGTVLGRTPIHWLLLVCFYVCFFSGLACYSFLCYWLFEITLKEDAPKYLLSQPGFSFEPALGNKPEIEYHEKSNSDIEEILHHINLALSKYGPVPKEHFGDCQNVNGYGYRERKPCLFLKINRIIGFKTQPIESVTDLPLEAPHELRVYIKDLPPDERKNRIWLSCDSRPTLNFIYYPNRYYSTANVNWSKLKRALFLNFDDQRFFNESDYERIIGLQLKGVRLNVIYRVRCIMWAKNIERDYIGKMGKGLIRFSLLINS